MNVGGSRINLDELHAVCKRHAYLGADAVVSEPYVPHFPTKLSDWNGTLVVAVAQNLASKQHEYRKWLESLEPHDRWNRLNTDGSPLKGIGIGPWDDGTMKLCVAVLRGADAVERVAVSNAVLWSGGDSGSNGALSKQAKAASAEAWREMLDVMNPTEVIAFGADARVVMGRAGVVGHRMLEMPGPFSKIYNIGFKMNAQRLLSAFPEVAEAKADLTGLVELKHEALAIHCACACVSKMMEPKERPGVR